MHSNIQIGIAEPGDCLLYVGYSSQRNLKLTEMTNKIVEEGNKKKMRKILIENLLKKLGNWQMKRKQKNSEFKQQNVKLVHLCI